ncbi:MAG: Fe-S oxidoreductase [Draconibacterium sp.]|nr:MAG: Fe-S oxidoreductase [Draconibacterium sp.]
MNVNAFIPCFIDQLYPGTAHSFIKVLKLAGCSVHYNPEQTCCGQPAFNSGYWKEARTMAVKFLTEFTNSTCLISPSASCTGFIKNYYHRLLEDTPDKLQMLDNLIPRLFEFTDFLVNHLQKIDFGAVFPYKVTFHDSCAGLREYGIEKEPRILLKKVKGLELTELDDRNTCCGFGGTFAAKFHSISTANLESYIKKQNLPIKTIHIADILATNG